MIKNLFKHLLAKKGEKQNFATVNQPCYDKNGKFLGWYSRSVATAIFFFCRDKNGTLHVLASERGKGAADFNGLWNCPCGYLDHNETTRQCAAREMLEETGIGISEEAIKFISYEDDPVKANHQNITFRFGAYDPENVIERLSKFSRKRSEKNEVGKIKWIPLNEIDKYQWAFGHKTLIVEVARQMQLI